MSLLPRGASDDSGCRCRCCCRRCCCCCRCRCCCCVQGLPPSRPSGFLPRYLRRSERRLPHADAGRASDGLLLLRTPSRGSLGRTAAVSAAPPRNSPAGGGGPLDSNRAEPLELSATGSKRRRAAGERGPRPESPMGPWRAACGALGGALPATLSAGPSTIDTRREQSDDFSCWSPTQQLNKRSLRSPSSATTTPLGGGRACVGTPRHLVTFHIAVVGRLPRPSAGERHRRGSRPARHRLDSPSRCGCVDAAAWTRRRSLRHRSTTTCGRTRDARNVLIPLFKCFN
ncbi:unnamed protein product [Lampetra fluviatilis]